jgi:DNA-binding XRE family transcriptional regulator
MTASGFPQEQIADQIGITRKTLRKHFRAEIKTGKTSANAMIARSLFKKATGDGPQSVAAAIFWLKTQAGWRETQNHEITGKGGKPISVVIQATDEDANL